MSEWIKMDWAATARAIGCDRRRVCGVIKGTEKSQRISAALRTCTVKKICWRAVAELASEGRPKPYEPRYVREVAKGFRENKRLLERLWKMQIIELLKQQDEEAKRIKESFTNNQTAEVL
ncbi:MAG: hypothetical protein FWC26_06310 [Fibromonadales bacterium]|nr:hypothetical protein [Fibromonadales bacterium]